MALLNGGYGVIEMVGGLLLGSQALKADALDFLGDGLITFLGIVALGWQPPRRARVALVQGLFLGALGLGVMATTVIRMLVARQLDAEVMGVLGAVGLAVNVAAAVVLIPYRSGDVNVRAVWLFSRNDALGNVAVVVAAGLVYVDRNALARPGCGGHHRRAVSALGMGDRATSAGDTSCVRYLTVVPADFLLPRAGWWIWR